MILMLIYRLVDARFMKQMHSNDNAMFIVFVGCTTSLLQTNASSVSLDVVLLLH